MQLQLEKPWKLVMAKLMEHDTKLTAEDLHYEKGKDESFI
ncbi:MAG: hypothetical protein NVSMB7_15370 [Chitinophagaceae bacterium]